MKGRAAKRHIRAYPRYTLEILEENDTQVFTATNIFYKIADNIMVTQCDRELVYNTFKEQQPHIPHQVIYEATKQTMITDVYDFEWWERLPDWHLRRKARLSKDDRFEPEPDYPMK